MWDDVYVGYYAFTIILTITRPETFSQTFKVYYTVHHSLSFLVTGSWALMTCCEWETYVHRGLMLWLGAGLWSYIHNVYTSINPTIGKALFRKLKLVVFAPVQTQKMTSYVRGLIVTGLKPSKLAVVILGTGFVLDFGNAVFVCRSIYRSFFEKKEE